MGSYSETLIYDLLAVWRVAVLSISYCPHLSGTTAPHQSPPPRSYGDIFLILFCGYYKIKRPNKHSCFLVTFLIGVNLQCLSIYQFTLKVSWLISGIMSPSAFSLQQRVRKYDHLISIFTSRAPCCHTLLKMFYVKNIH